MTESLPSSVRIVEVGPRDGLQNEPTPVSTAEKIAFITALRASGLQHIEATSFVHPQRVPQLADAAEVAAAVLPSGGAHCSALVPNGRGLERAMAAGFRRVAVFTAASDTFTQRNINMTVAESLRGFAAVCAAALQAGLSVRGYVSTAFDCPYEGAVDPRRVADVSAALLDMGVDEIAVSDTLGVAVPTDVHRVLDAVVARVPIERVALHFHDTCGTALANVVAGLQRGVTTFDASAGGLGGCPFAPGASGNLATEDLVYLLERMGVATGVDLTGVVAAARRIAAALGRPLTSHQADRGRGCG